MRWRTCSGSSCGSGSASTACRASCSSTCTTPPPRAASDRRGRGDRHRRRLRRCGLPLHDPRGVARRPADRVRSARSSTRDLVMAATSPSRCCPASPASGSAWFSIALGSGGVKANATSLVGSLYDGTTPAATPGFSLFYMGINLGALLGPLLTGLLQKDGRLPLGLRGSPRSAWRSASSSTPSAASTSPRRPRRSPTRCRPRHALVRRVGVAAVAVVVVLVLVGVITAEQPRRRRRRSAVVAPRSPYFAVILSRQAVTRAERSRDLRVHPAVRRQRRRSGRSTSSSSPS